MCNILEKLLPLPNQTNKHDIQYVGVQRPFQAPLQGKSKPIGSVNVPQADTGAYRGIFTFKKVLGLLDLAGHYLHIQLFHFSVCAVLIH